MTQTLAHRCARAVGGGSGTFTADLHQAFDVLGVPAGQLQERVNSATGLVGGAAWNAMLNWQIGTIGSQALAITNLFGAGAHIWKPGIGTLSGITCGNFSDVTGLVPAVADGTVARCNDATASGANNLLQTTPAQQPLVRSSGGLGWWECNSAANQGFACASSPISMGTDHAVVVCASTTLGTGNRTLFGNAGAGSQRVATILVGATLSATWRDDASTTVQLVGGTQRLNSPMVLAARQVGQNREFRMDGVPLLGSSAALGTTTLTGASIGILPNNTSGLSGNIYAAIIISGTVTDSQMALLEAFAANSAGIALAI